jgi:hypothetical protein
MNNPKESTQVVIEKQNGGEPNQTPAPTVENPSQNGGEPKPVSVEAQLIEALTNFAKGYKAIETAETTPAWVNKLLAIKIERVAVCHENAQQLVRKETERLANTMDRTLRPEQRVAHRLLEGDVWEWTLERKNPCLYYKVRKIVSKLLRLETLMQLRGEELAPIMPKLQIKFPALCVSFVKRLSAIYSGACWDSFQELGKDLGKVVQEVEDILDPKNYAQSNNPVAAKKAA